MFESARKRKTRQREKEERGREEGTLAQTCLRNVTSKETLARREETKKSTFAASQPLLLCNKHSEAAVHNRTAGITS
jgi:hypothetical protein